MVEMSVALWRSERFSLARIMDSKCVYVLSARLCLVFIISTMCKQSCLAS